MLWIGLGLWPGKLWVSPRMSGGDIARKEGEVVFSTLRDKLSTAVVGDVLDTMGWRRQFLPQAIGPLKPDMKFVGRAMPVLEADIFDDSARSPGGSKPFGLMLEALDDLRPNE